MMSVLSPIRQGEEAERLAPLGLEPGRLWSLWDMIAPYAWHFYLISRFVQDMRHRLALPPLSIPTPPPATAGIGGYLRHTVLFPQNALASLPSPPTNPHITKDDSRLTDEDCEELKRLFDLLEDSCCIVGMQKVVPQIKRASNWTFTYQDKTTLRTHVDILSDRIVDELSEKKFLQIPTETLVHYENETPFGSLKLSKIDGIMEDMVRAGTCYSVGQNTACVFHLMRVMEYCVQKLGRRLGVTIDTRNESWHQIMIHVHKNVEKLPGGKAATSAQNNRKEKLSMVASHLDHVRLAWRNKVMHPKDTYDEDEARQVLDGVKSFVVSLSGLI